MIGKQIASVFFMLLVGVAAASAMEPMETVKGPIDAVIAILNDPQYTAPGTKTAQRDEIWKTVQPMFDFGEISRRTVARNWTMFNDTEKKEFTDVFAQFLGNTYIDKIQGEYHNEKIVYLDQDFYSDAYAEVRTQLLRETVEIPVNYRMFKNSAGQWKVYDITVEGVSLVKNYRTQFASILQKDPPSRLIQILNDKLANQKQQLSDKG
jgi:phospholipid transport system substrate-binding protein